MTFSLVQRTPLSIDIERGVSHLSDREAMGLAEFYQPSAIDLSYEEWYAKLINSPKNELLDYLQNPEIPFSQRYTAGNVLALIGDPRIAVLEPTMIAIPEWKGILGLHPDQIDGVVEAYKNLGILSNWIEKESPQYVVDIKPFKIAKYPVTNKEYLAFLLDSEYKEIPTSWKFRQFPHHLSNHPVYTISERAALDYCSWISSKTGRKFRLPTESEWEYAAMGKEEYEFPWGNEFLRDRTNTAETGIYQTTAIGTFPLGDSPFGCSDMAGNVEEYVADFYQGYNETEAVLDDLVEINGKYRVARGGSFTRFRDLTRCKRRHGYNPKEIYVMGFRLAEEF